PQRAEKWRGRRLDEPVNAAAFCLAAVSCHHQQCLRSEGTMSVSHPNPASTPQAPGVSDHSDRSPDFHTTMSGEPIKLLLVEDNPGAVALLNIMLFEESAARISIETASRIAEAAERLDRGGIDVVLLDLTLPDAQGIE